MRLSNARRACVEAMMKDTIFDAAGALLEEKGTDGLTMDRVASKVGVATAGAPYVPVMVTILEAGTAREICPPTGTRSDNCTYFWVPVV